MLLQQCFTALLYFYFYEMHPVSRSEPMSIVLKMLTPTEQDFNPIPLSTSHRPEKKKPQWSEEYPDRNQTLPGCRQMWRGRNECLLKGPVSEHPSQSS